MPITALPPHPDDLVRPDRITDGSGLGRELTFTDALAVNASAMLAVTVFVAPAVILAGVGTAFLSAAAWLTAGVVTWCGAVTFAELGSLLPHAGGPYVFLTRAYSRFVGFLYGWTVIAVIQSASIAAVAVASTTYLGTVWTLSPAATTGGAVGVIMTLSAWNASGMRASLNGLRVLAVSKLALMTIVAIACFWMGGDGADAFRRLVPDLPPTRIVAGFVSAVTAALWAYTGWLGLTFLGGEMQQPARTLPRALSYSVIAMTGVALVLTTSFLWALPADLAAASRQVAADVADHAFGRVGRGLVTLTVVVTCLAAVNALLVTGGRVVYAMARDGLFRPWGAAVSERKVPAHAILVQGTWASALTLTGRYEQLFTSVVFAVWLFYMLGAFAVIVLRHRMPNEPRPYRVPGYPYVTVVFGVIAWAFLLHTLWDSPRDSLFGLALMLTGLPAYWYWSGRMARAGLLGRWRRRRRRRRYY